MNTAFASTFTPSLRHRASASSALSSRSSRTFETAFTMSLQVAVSGATGRTGRLVHNLLSIDANFSPRALVRSASKAKEVLGEEADIREVDITTSSSDALRSALRGCQSLVLLTSAIPQILNPGPPPEFGYPQGGMPELVDYEGAMNQINAARAEGVQHVIFIGSMGSTNVDHSLNKMGNGKILVYKRKAEEYLIECKDIDYTVINPAGLLDLEPCTRRIVFGKSDDIFDKYDAATCGIARADVARVVVAALTDPNARNKAFDVASLESDQPTMEFSELFEKATPGLLQPAL